jgi:hypothetical protein
MRDVRIKAEAFERILKSEKLLQNGEYIAAIRLEIPIKDGGETTVLIRASND